MSGNQSKITRHEEKQKVKTRSQGENESTEGDPEDVETMELTDKDVKTAVGNMPHMFRKEEEYIIGEAKNKKKSQMDL